MAAARLRSGSRRRVLVLVALIAMFGAVTAVADAAFTAPPVVGVWQGPETLQDGTPHGIVTLAVEAESATSLQVFLHDDVVTICGLTPGVSFFRAKWNESTQTIESLDRLRVCTDTGEVGSFVLTGPLYSYDDATDTLSWAGPGSVVNDLERLCVGNNATWIGGPGNDTYIGTSGPDVLEGRGGNDHLVGKGGFDVLCGGPGADQLEGKTGADLLWGDDGADLLIGGGGFDGLFGNAGNDTLNAGGARDMAQGGTGTDEVSGGNGADWLFGGAKRDIMSGNSGNDKMWGGGGNDEIRGRDGNDKMYGQSNDDKIVGGNGTDTAFGGKGTDNCKAETTKDCE